MIKEALPAANNSTLLFLNFYLALSSTHMFSYLYHQMGLEKLNILSPEKKKDYLILHGKFLVFNWPSENKKPTP